MKANIKYKFYNNNKLLTLSRIPKRILKFKRSKWTETKNLLKNRLINDTKITIENQNLISFSDPTKINVHISGAKYTRNYYLFRCLTKNKILLKFENQFNFKFFQKIYKNNSDIQEILLNVVCKPLYNLFILLRELNFFISSYECREAIKNNKILINNKEVVLKRNIFVKGGDIILVQIDFAKSPSIKRNSIIGQTSILTFLEVDYYTGTIIITKDYDALDEEDLYLLMKDYIDTHYLY